MKYMINKGGTAVVVEHRNKSIEFPKSKTFPKNTFKKSEDMDVFKSINMYLLTLPISSLDGIFIELEKLFNMGKLGSGRQPTKTTIDPFYDYLEVETRLIPWVNANVPVPTKVLDTTKIGKNHTECKTYMKEDYINLLVGAIIAKAMLPHMYVYMVNLREDPKFKNRAAVQLLPARMLALPWYEKLRAYVSSYYGANPQDLHRLVNKGLSDKQGYEYTFAKVVLSKLTAAPVFNSSNGSHVITHIHSFMDTIVNSSSHGVSNKNPGGNSDDDDGEGVYQAYRSKDTISIATQLEIEHTVSKKYLTSMMHRFMNASQHDRYGRMCDSLSRQNLIITPEVMYICNWVISDIVHVKAFDTLEHKQLYSTIAFVYMLLEERHPFLAIFLVSNVVRDEVTGLPKIRKAQQVGNTKLTPELVETLSNLFPIYRTVGGSKVMINLITGLLNKETMIDRKVLVPINTLCKGTLLYRDKATKYLKPTENKRMLLASLLLDLDNLITDNQKRNLL